MTTILDGRIASAHIKEQLALEVDKLKAKGHRAPHLCAILVGNDPASQTYVKNKEIACEKSGFSSTLLRLDENISQEELIKTIEGINNNDEIDGLIVQLPLPKHLDEELVTDTISPKKDVDGFHTISTGLMVKGMETYLPATPYGILKMLEFYDIQTSGMDCVVIGRSNIVGRPMSILLSQNNKYGNCTVTLAHSRTKNLKEVVKRADLIIAAIGRPNFVTEEMVKEGAVIIDVGINRIEDKSRKSGSRLVGDVDFEGVKDKCAAITPVPGGVGPMTIGGLLENTMIAYKRSHNITATL